MSHADDLPALSFFEDRSFGDENNAKIATPKLEHHAVAPYLNCSESNTLFGVLCCVLSIALYVTNGEVVSYLQKTEPPLQCSYALIWISHTFQLVALPFAFGIVFKERSKWRSAVEEKSKRGFLTQNSSYRYLELLQKTSFETEPQLRSVSSEDMNTSRHCGFMEDYLATQLDSGNFASVVGKVLYLTIIYHLSAWSWALSLGQSDMSVGVTTAIFCSSPVFVFLIWTMFSFADTPPWQSKASCFAKCNSDFWIQILAVCLAVIGVLCLAYRTEAAGGFGLGALFSAAGAGLYALFEVLYKRDLLNSSSNPPTTFALLVVGLMGSFYLTVLWIPIPILSYFELEPINRPPTSNQILILIFNGFIITCFQLCLQLSLCFLPSPLLVSLASLLCMPAAQVTDWFLKTGQLTTPAIVGSSFVALSFVVMLVQETRKVEEAEQAVVEYNLKITHGFQPFDPNDLTSFPGGWMKKPMPRNTATGSRHRPKDLGQEVAAWPPPVISATTARSPNPSQISLG